MKNSTTSHKSLFLLTSCLLMAAATVTAEKVVAADELPGPISLNGDWQFQLAPNADAASALGGFASPDFDASGFVAIPVPANWNMLGFEDPHYVNGTPSEGFYRTTFTAPEDLEGILTTLHFGGVWVSAEVWLNGQLLGQHDSGFTAFAFDLTDAIKAGEENLLAVRVRQQLPNNLFKFDANDDWGLAGIYRDVWIDFKPEFFYIGGVGVGTDFYASFPNADLQLRGFTFRHAKDDYFSPSPPFVGTAPLFARDGGRVT
ncbi:MAG: sugar-binding domain-containing protein, partial [Puniceicoccaceae bacterium]